MYDWNHPYLTFRLFGSRIEAETKSRRANLSDGELYQRETIILSSLVVPQDLRYVWQNTSLQTYSQLFERSKRVLL